jgi:pimeloyl-ACP methyl ester carboxylesterase
LVHPKRKKPTFPGDDIDRQVLNANGIELFVRSNGHPGAPLALFLYGFPEHSGGWDQVLPEFVPQLSCRGAGPAGLPRTGHAYHLVRTQRT